MKIVGHDIIKLITNIKKPGLLNDIQKGGEIRAEIVERIDNKTAILDINGKRIRAEFTGGIPKSNFLELKLENNNDTYIFKLIKGNDSTELFNRLADIFLIKIDALKNRLNDIYKLLNNNITGIFQLNRDLIDPNGNERDRKTIQLLNCLLKLGLNKEVLINLSFLLSGNGINKDILIFIYAIYNFDIKSKKSSFKLKFSEIEEIITDIIIELHSINDIDLKKDIILQLIDILFLNQYSENIIDNGEFYFLEDDEFRAINYFYNHESLIFSLNLSNLGIIDIMARKIDNKISISIFSGNEDVITVLKKSANILKFDLNNLGPVISLNFINTKNMMDNLKDFYRNYSINNIIDFKV